MLILVEVVLFWSLLSNVILFVSRGDTSLLETPAVFLMRDLTKQRFH